MVSSLRKRIDVFSVLASSLYFPLADQPASAPECAMAPDAIFFSAHVRAVHISRMAFSLTPYIFATVVAWILDCLQRKILITSLTVSRVRGFVVDLGKRSLWNEEALVRACIECSDRDQTHYENLK